MTTSPKIKTGGEREQFQRFAAELRDLQDSRKDAFAALAERASAAGIDPAGLRRFVTWKRQDEEKRAQREAIDQQCRYLAGERDTPAALPVGCELARAIHLFRRNMTVRAVAEEMHISTGKAGKLLQLSRMFSVHVHADVDKPRKAKVDVITPPEVAALPAHDADGVVIESVVQPSSATDAEAARAIPPATDADLAAQRESWVRAEMAFGSDADEAAERAALRASSPERVAEQKPEDDGLEIPSFLRRPKVTV